MSWILIIVVLLLLFGGGGFYSYSRGGVGIGAIGGVATLLVVFVIIYLLFGHSFV
jgi:hypothetical protein